VSSSTQETDPSMASVGGTDLDVFRLCLGGNVFGWTIDEARSMEVLDAYAAGGGNFIDTADVYSAFHPGNVGGESETIIGNWMASRGNRDEMVIATKVGMLDGRMALDEANIRYSVEASLKRLQTDYIDLYYAHRDDPDVDQQATLAVFDQLVREGKVRHIAASNHTAARLASALDVSRREGLAAYVAVQPEYNLLDRAGFERELATTCLASGLSCVPYYGLAAGFLTGKYRRGGAPVEGTRAQFVADRYMHDRGFRVLDALEEIAAERDVAIAAVALAWLAGASTVAAPIASATSTAQLEQMLPGARMRLSAQERDRLVAASDLDPEGPS
jgi:aryl-alcohol dehydrogenase-like predicted oxidoreductase